MWVLPCSHPHLPPLNKSPSSPDSVHFWHHLPGQDCHHTYTSDWVVINRGFPWPPSQVQSLLEWLTELRKTLTYIYQFTVKDSTHSQIKYSQIKCNITAENNISRLSSFILECKNRPTLKKSINKNSYKLKEKPYILIGIQKSGDNLLIASIEK